MRIGEDKKSGAVVTQISKAPWHHEFDEPIIEFAGSEMFARLFKDGMAMVEETAAYLDGQGRKESKLLPRKVALAYAGESMRLTTRLMQVASWLLVVRTIKEGEMQPVEASEEKYRVAAHEICRGRAMDGADLLPQRLLDLLDISEKVYERIDRLDGSMFRRSMHRGFSSTVSRQINQLEEAFGAARS